MLKDTLLIKDVEIYVLIIRKKMWKYAKLDEGWKRKLLQKMEHCKLDD